MTGEEFTALMRRLGHTQETAAAAMGISRGAVAQWVALPELSRRAETQVRQLTVADPQLLRMAKRLLTIDDAQLARLEVV